MFRRITASFPRKAGTRKSSDEEAPDSRLRRHRSLEARREPRDERPIHAQLDTVVEPVNRQLQEAVELQVVRDREGETRTEKHGQRYAQFRLGARDGVLALDHAVDLQQSLQFMTEGIAITDVELELIAGLVVLLGAHG